jgi:glycosyltransferase involved in cell wall biosynthesis
MDDIPIPEDIIQIKKPIVGYIGALSDWVDFDIIKAISKEYPELSVVLIGPEFSSVKSEIEALKQYPNIFILGAKPYKILPSYLKAFDVSIIPFKINELTLSSNPIKFYEYISSGKNVISVNLPEIKVFDDTIHIADNIEEFLQFIPTSLNEKVDVEKFLEIAEENTWDKKADRMIEFIVQKLTN